MPEDTLLPLVPPGDLLSSLPIANANPALAPVQFFNLPLMAALGAFVPRAETELLARVAVELAGTAREEVRVIDMCCGVGNLAVVVATHAPTARVWASDVMTLSAHNARHNMERHGLTERVTVSQGDLFTPLAGRGLEGTVDLIVCNPPYISTKRLAQRTDLLANEPREAFDAGPFGLSIHQRVVRAACAFLRPGGWLVLEFGAGQARQIKRLFERTRGYGETQIYADASGMARVAAAQANGTFAGV